jgi:ribosomal protein S18 acetylase RimI-like enzyme
MSIKLVNAVKIALNAEINQVTATLTMAFDADPVARWMYPEPEQYLRCIPQLFLALGASSFQAKAAYRTDDGSGAALWLPPGVAGDDDLLETVVRDTIAETKQADVAALFERTEHYRPQMPHWYLSLIGIDPWHRNKGIGASLVKYVLRQCDQEHCAVYLWSSNPKNASFYQRHGFESLGTIQVGSSPPIFPMVRYVR